MDSAPILRELESENAKLKKLLAEAHLDMHALKSVLGVKRRTSALQRCIKKPARLSRCVSR